MGSMKTQWNKVTPLSRSIALALFVALPFVGFWFGAQYGEGVAYLQAQNSANGGAAESADAYYTNVSEWQAYANNSPGWGIAYPVDFETQGSPGKFELVVPRLFEPHTNFAEAKLTVGQSIPASDCMKPTPGGPVPVPTSTAVINGVTFNVFRSDGAGAGNFYDTTSYRTVHYGKCFALEYTIHSTNIYNYPQEYHLREFNAARVRGMLDRIVGTFKFY